MNVTFVAAPGGFGPLVLTRLTADPGPQRIVLVSAFNNRQTLLRLRAPVLTAKEHGATVRVVVGIDLYGTSEEALSEILSWGVDARVAKQGRPGHTFHPKLYLLERENLAEIFVGSNNITEGGLYRNFECLAHVAYDLPVDQAAYQLAQDSLAPLLDPTGPIVRPLSEELIQRLARQGVVRPQRELQRRMRQAEAVERPRLGEEPLFGNIHIPDPPPVPEQVLTQAACVATRERRARLRRVGRGRKIVVNSPAELAPFAFYMELNKLQGANIPGEARVPMEARDLAEEFWGWPHAYRRETRRGGQKERVYWNYKPGWRIIDAANPDDIFYEDVRMYEYEASADFRFYANRLVELGADEGDIVRITRIDGADVDFECVLAKEGTPQYQAWRPYCTRPVRNSTRQYGYA